MSKLLCNVLKVSGEANALNISPLVARLPWINLVMRIWPGSAAWLHTAGLDYCTRSSQYC